MPHASAPSQRLWMPASPLIDTAPVYGFGHSEEIVGRAIAASGKRDSVIIATKVGLAWDQNEKVKRDCTPARIRQEIQDSLRRLKTSYIDLYQVHWPDPLVPIAQTAEVLGALYKEGKIRAIGVSNYSSAQIEAFAQVAPLHTVQPPYNLFERGIEGDIVPCAKKHGLSILAYGAICRGLLGGRMQADTTFTGDDLRKNDPKFQAPEVCALPRGKCSTAGLCAGTLPKRPAPLGHALALGPRLHRPMGRPATQAT